MSQTSKKLSDLIDCGIKKAVADAIEKHRRLGQSISIWQDGKVVTIPANEIENLDKYSSN